MAKASILENIELEVMDDILSVVHQVFGSEDIDDAELEKTEAKAKQFIANMHANKNIDYDLRVILKYRLGQMKKNFGVTKTIRKKIKNALDNGFNVPDDATAIEISILPFIETKELNGEVTKKQGKTVFFRKAIYFGKKREKDTFTIKDFKDNKILHFYTAKQEKTI